MDSFQNSEVLRHRHTLYSCICVPDVILIAQEFLDIKSMFKFCGKFKVYDKTMKSLYIYARLFRHQFMSTLPCDSPLTFFELTPILFLRFTVSITFVFVSVWMSLYY